MSIDRGVIATLSISLATIQLLAERLMPQSWENKTVLRKIMPLFQQCDLF